MVKAIDLTGQRFGRLVAIERVGTKGNHEASWLCKCDCGNQIEVRSGHLRSGASQSCGCFGREKTSELFLDDLSGMVFGRLTVLKRDFEKENNSGSAMWLCRCECGNICSVLSPSLKIGLTKSCGCYHNEIISKNSRAEISGKTFGKLLVLSFSHVENEKTIWICKCSCGETTLASAIDLSSGKVQSCGCLKGNSFIAEEATKYFKENYSAIPEYKILKNPDTDRYLPYDIYIPFGENPETNGIYIEVHGNQHYKLNGWHFQAARQNGTTPEEEFEYQKWKDKIKKKFAKNNGVYIEIDLRKIKTTEQAIKYIEEILETLS